MYVVAILLIPALLGALLLVPYRLRRVAVQRLAVRCRERRAIVLSYDDGPSATLTPRLLALLGARGVRASFFLLGRNAAGLAELVRCLLREGHEIGSHTHHHTNAWKSDPVTALRDVEKGLGTLAPLGVRSRLFRPPYGKLTLGGLVAGARWGLQYGRWTIDSRDSWQRRSIDDVVAEIAAKGGGVILMHDVERDVLPPDDVAHSEHLLAEHLLALTSRIIDVAETESCRIRCLGEVVVA
jgi:peptidoglycan/xylan/chitin deacetylase (PgdA/CDA1 family)